MKTQDPQYYLGLLEDFTTHIFSFTKNIPTEELRELYETDPHFRKNLMLELRDISIISDKFQEVLSREVTSELIDP